MLGALGPILMHSHTEVHRCTLKTDSTCQTVTLVHSVVWHMLLSMKRLPKVCVARTARLEVQRSHVLAWSSMMSTPSLRHTSPKDVARNIPFAFTSKTLTKRHLTLQLTQAVAVGNAKPKMYCNILSCCRCTTRTEAVLITLNKLHSCYSTCLVANQPPSHHLYHQELHFTIHELNSFVSFGSTISVLRCDHAGICGTNLSCHVAWKCIGTTHAGPL